MEKIERKQSADSDQKEKDFFVINSVGELLPFIFIAFFFTYMVGSQKVINSTVSSHTEAIVQMSEAKISEQQNILKNRGEDKEKIYLNASPAKVEANKLPKIKAERKKSVIQKESHVEKEENHARPHFPKAEYREVLPVIEVVQPLETITPSKEKFSYKEEKEISLEVMPEEVYTSSNSTIVLQPKIITTLEKEISPLETAKVNIAKMTVKPNLTPKTIELDEEETVVEEVIVKDEKLVTKTPDLAAVVNYKPAEFKWAVNNYNHGIKKSPKFINTPDAKAAYCRTDAGILLKINDLSDVNTSYGIFVEKSEDGEEYNSIGIINAENKDELFYFDSENSYDGQHHYRFRSTNNAGDELEFGKVSVIRRASVSLISSQVNTTGKYNLLLNSNGSQGVNYQIEEAWGSLNGDKGTKQLIEGENTLSFDLAGDPGLYFLTISTANQAIELLIEKPGISPDLSFYDQEVSGKQSFNKPQMPLLLNKPKPLSFDFYLKNGNTLIFNQGEYNSETVRIKKANIGELPETLQARHSEETLWFTASSNISYLHQKVPVILEHNNQEIAAQINIFSSKNTIRPISHFSPNGDGEQDDWKIPGIKSCPNTDLMVFNDWGNLIYKTKNVTEKNIWNGQKDGQNLPNGMYYYVLGQYGGWVQLER